MAIQLPELELEKCTGCGECVIKCPTNAVELVDGKAAVVNPEKCNYCAECEAFCRQNAIRCPFEIILVKEDHRS